VLAVKSYAVESTVRPLVGALAENGRLLALQNGLGHVAALTVLPGLVHAIEGRAPKRY
jgi:ketopantoate reductase